MVLEPYAPLELFKEGFHARAKSRLRKRTNGPCWHSDCGYNQNLQLIASIKPEGANEADITG